MKVPELHVTLHVDHDDQRLQCPSNGAVKKEFIKESELFIEATTKVKDLSLLSLKDSISELE